MLNFQPYDFPTLGYVKIPRFEITEEQKKKLGVAENVSSNDFLVALSNAGLRNKVRLGKIKKKDLPAYQLRLDLELAEIIRLFFADYILLVYNVMDFCRRAEILNGFSRGSCGGSIILYCIGCTGIDPIRHELLFERFISSARTSVKEFGGEMYISSGSLPDVDIDSDGSKKYLINEYIAKCFPGKTCAISTFGTYQSKLVLKEAYKILENASEEEAKIVSDHVETKFGKVDTIQDTIQQNGLFADWAKQHEETVKVACQLLELIRNKSTHASGILICDSLLDDVMPLELTPDKTLSTAYDMNDAQMYGVKLDNLGLKNLTAIDDCVRAVSIKMSDIDVNDPCIYEFLNSSTHYHGIFQAEKGLGKRVLQKLECQNVDDISMSIAIGRPGAMGFLDDIVKSKRTGELRKIDPRVSSILGPTQNTIIYQEQIMALSRTMASFTGLEADKVRKIIGKKLKDQMPEWKGRFIDGSIKNGYEKEFAEEIWQTFEKAGDYSFNKCIQRDAFVHHKTKGRVRMHDVRIDDEILCLNTTTGLDEYNKVKNIYKNTVCTYEIASNQNRNLKIRASKDHKFLTMTTSGECGMVQVKDFLNYQNIGLVTTWGIVREIGVSYYGEEETLDFEIDSNDHNFYANDIVVSNSHSTGYGYLCAITAYLKAKYPVAFFTALLKNAKNEQDTIGEIKAIAAELPAFNINFKGPHIIKSTLDFSFQDQDIFFGLSHVKGISEKSIEKLNGFRKNFTNKFEIFKSAKDAGLNIGIVCNLIMVGALDDFITETRAKTAFEAQVWSKLTDKEMISCLEHGEKYKFSVVDTVKALINDIKTEKGKPSISASRAETLRGKIKDYYSIYKKNSKNHKLTNYWFENKLLGFSYSSSLKEGFEEMKLNLDLNTISDTKKMGQRESACFVGEVVHVSQGLTKAKGVPYYKVVVRDHTDEMTCFLYETDRNAGISFNRDNNGGKMPEEDDIVFVRGLTSRGDCFNADLISIQEIEVYGKASELK